MRRQLSSNVMSRRRVMLKLRKRRLHERQRSHFNFQKMDA